MHFLSHYYTELPNNNPLFVVGLIVPDLTSNFTRLYNHHIKNAPAPGQPQQAMVHAGILKHFEGDKKFHNSAAFMQHTAMCTRSLVTEGLNRNRLRLSVLAHLAVEMLIDRQIVIQHEAVCNDFYAVIDKAAEDDLIAYFNLYGLEGGKRNFLSKFQFFRGRRFIYMFKDLGNVVMGLSRIYSNVLRIELTEDEKHRLLAGLNNIDTIIRYSWQDMLKA